MIYRIFPILIGFGPKILGLDHRGSSTLLSGDPTLFSVPDYLDLGEGLGADLVAAVDRKIDALLRVWQ